jgi:hypothetical protein
MIVYVSSVIRITTWLELEDLCGYEIYPDMNYMVVTTSSNTLGKEPPCIVQVPKTQLYFANHHIIIS